MSVSKLQTLQPRAWQTLTVTFLLRPGPAESLAVIFAVLQFDVTATQKEFSSNAEDVGPEAQCGLLAGLLVWLVFNRLPNVKCLQSAKKRRILRPHVCSDLASLSLQVTCARVGQLDVSQECFALQNAPPHRGRSASWTWPV